MSAIAVPEIDYPVSDGEPMSDHMLQFQWISTIALGLSTLYKQNPDVLVAGNILWYPVEGNNKIRIGPDVLIAFGRPKGVRGSYRQWEEEDIPPQVVFEILSPGNRAGEMAYKMNFYQTYGVEEYYVYDPHHNELKGYHRQDDGLFDEIIPMHGHVSPRLGIRFDMSGLELVIYRPDGKSIITYEEQDDLIEQASLKAEQAAYRAEQAAYRAEEESRRAQAAETAMEKMRKKLRDAGLDPDS